MSTRITGQLLTTGGTSEESWKAGYSYAMERMKDEQCICDQCDVDRDFKKLEARCERLEEVLRNVQKLNCFYGNEREIDREIEQALKSAGEEV